MLQEWFNLSNLVLRALPCPALPCPALPCPALPCRCQEVGRDESPIVAVHIVAPVITSITSVIYFLVQGRRPAVAVANERVSVLSWPECTGELVAQTALSALGLR